MAEAKETKQVHLFPAERIRTKFEKSHGLGHKPGTKQTISKSSKQDINEKEMEKQYERILTGLPETKAESTGESERDKINIHTDD